MRMSGTPLPSEAEIEEANREVLRRMAEAEAILIDLVPAADVLPELGEHDFLHAGPPLRGWADACGPLRGAVVATLLHEGRAKDALEAERLAETGEVNLVSANRFGAAATFGGVITRSTNVFVVENKKGGTYGFAAINEGRGKALRYGSHDAETLSRYAWLEGEFANMLSQAIRKSGGIDLFAILRQCLSMGDEGHSRQKAASSLFANAIAPHMAAADFPAPELARALRFLGENEIFFLSLTMAAGKAAMRAAERVPNSTIVTCMAANGVEWGIQVSGNGTTWFTAPVPEIQGVYFQGFGPDDASPVIGDSEIAETMGLGAFALAAAPALARYMGGTVAAAVELSARMYEITAAEHPIFKIGALEFRGAPCGIDVRLVVEKEIAPVFNSGIAHHAPGVGQIGAGYGYVPIECCRAAVASIVDRAE
jgi:hypothetical protein